MFSKKYPTNFNPKNPSDPTPWLFRPVIVHDGQRPIYFQACTTLEDAENFLDEATAELPKDGIIKGVILVY